MNSQQRWFDLLILAGCLLLGFTMLGPVLSIPLHIPLSYNEGWNAIFASRAVMPGAPPLYPPPGSFVFNNYPPLSFTIVGVLGRFVVGDMIVAGRIVSLVSMLAVAALVLQCVRCLGGSLRGGLAAALVMLLTTCVFFRTYLAMDDPQWLAQAFMMGGLMAVVHNDGVARMAAGEVPVRKLAIAALLMLAGGFVKHNEVALPLTMTVWLAMVNRRGLAAWVGIASAGLAAAALIVAGLYGYNAFNDILHHRRIYRASLMKNAFFRLEPVMPMAAITAIFVWFSWRAQATGNQRTRTHAEIGLIAIFIFIATLIGVLQRYGEGVYYNAHFEALVAISLGFGIALSNAHETMPRWRTVLFAPALLTGIAAVPVILASPWHIPIAWHDIADRAAREQEWRPMIRTIAASPGPAGCMSMSLCYWAGKPSDVDVFNLTELAEAGGSVAGFQAAAHAHEFAIFQDDPASFTHRDGIRRVGHDPVMQPLTEAGYAIIAHGPDNTVLMAPSGIAH